MGVGMEGGGGGGGGARAPPVFYLRDFINIHTCSTDRRVAVYTRSAPPEWKCFLRIAMHVTTVKNSLVTKLIIVSKAMDPVLNAFKFSGLTHLPIVYCTAIGKKPGNETKSFFPHNLLHMSLHMYMYTQALFIDWLL